MKATLLALGVALGVAVALLLWVFTLGIGYQAASAAAPDGVAVVLICDSNPKYFERCLRTVRGVRGAGRYLGDVCLVTDQQSRSKYQAALNHDPRLEVVAFDKIDVPSLQTLTAAHPEKASGCALKFNLFRPFFRKWRYVLYIDCGVRVRGPLGPIFATRAPGRLLAHSDAYPEYTRTLRHQFDDGKAARAGRSAADTMNVRATFEKLESRFNLDVDYFQSTLMLYDTVLASAESFDAILRLYNNYPIGKLNDQCFLSLYFGNIARRWTQIPLRGPSGQALYDYHRRLRHGFRPPVLTKI